MSTMFKVDQTNQKKKTYRKSWAKCYDGVIIFGSESPSLNWMKVGRARSSTNRWHNDVWISFMYSWTPQHYPVNSAFLGIVLFWVKENISTAVRFQATLAKTVTDKKFEWKTTILHTMYAFNDPLKWICRTPNGEWRKRCAEQTRKQTPRKLIWKEKKSN